MSRVKELMEALKYREQYYKIRFKFQKLYLGGIRMGDLGEDVTIQKPAKIAYLVQKAIGKLPMFKRTYLNSPAPFMAKLNFTLQYVAKMTNYKDLNELRLWVGDYMDKCMTGDEWSHIAICTRNELKDLFQPVFDYCAPDPEDTTVTFTVMESALTIWGYPVFNDKQGNESEALLTLFAFDQEGRLPNYEFNEP